MALDSTPMIVLACAAQHHVRNLRKHWICQILHHQRHIMCPGPTQRKNCLGLCLTRLERHAGPAERLAKFYEPPIMGAFVHEKWLSLRNACHIDPMLFQIVRERLLYVQNPVEGFSFIEFQPIQNLIDVGRLANRAIKIGRKPGRRRANEQYGRPAPDGRSPRRRRFREALL